MTEPIETTAGKKLKQYKANLHALNHSSYTSAPFSVWVEKAVSTYVLEDARDLPEALIILATAHMPESKFPVKIRVFDNEAGMFIPDAERSNLPL